MHVGRTLLGLGWLGLFTVALLWPPPADAYVDGAPTTLGALCNMSTQITVLQIEKFSLEKRVLVYRKVADLKGQYPRDVVKHLLGPTHGTRPDLLQNAQPGKTAILFSYWYGGAHSGLGGPESIGGLVRSYTYIDKQYYTCYVGNYDGGRCDDPRGIVQKYCGSPERLALAVKEVLAGKEVVIPCIVPDARGRPTIQRLRSNGRQPDYNPKRDFAGWGGEDYARINGMPGFSHQMQLPNLGSGAQGAAVVDLEGTGEAHLSLFGSGRIELLRSVGDAFLETSVPGLPEGCRSAVWADYNGDGKPDLLLATTTGPRLFTNLGNGGFRDDTALLPQGPTGNLTAAAWIDVDGDGRPDILLATGFYGLRLYRNLGKSEPVPGTVAPAGKPVPQRWFEDVSTQVGLGADGIGSAVKGDTLTVADMNGDGRPDFLYGASTGLLVLNTPKGFVEAKGSSIAYLTGGVGPVFGDFDNSGALSLFVPQRDGLCKLFRNDGKGHFTDVTARAGDLARPLGMAVCAAWGDIDNDGHVDLIVGCLKGPNRYFRNRGDGTFEDASARVGLDHRIFNTQAVNLADLNNDGILDIVFTNEGQHAVALLGDAALVRPRTPVVFPVVGKSGIVGSLVRVLDEAGKPVGSRTISGGEGRGGQHGPQAHFALVPGQYRVEVRSSSGSLRTHDLTVGTAPVRALVGEK